MGTFNEAIGRWYNELAATWSNPQFYMDKIWVVFKIFLLWIFAKFLIRIGTVAIGRIFSTKMSLQGRAMMDERRARTLSSLLSNVLRYGVYFFIGLTILEQLNFHVGTLLAGAGIAGLAIGFGAQNLVRDVITGFFIIFEDQFGVGDLVQIGMFRGTVDDIGLRITRIRAWTGELFIIPNGSITEVTNFSKTSSLAIVDVGVAYEEDLDRVFQVLQDVLVQAQQELPSIIAEPQVLGVQAFGPSEVTIRVVATTKPTENFAVDRELRRRIKSAFDKQGIEIPYPKQVMIPKNKQEAQPMLQPQGTPES